MHELDGPRLKVARAKEEIDRLRTIEDELMGNTYYRLVGAELNPISGRRIFRLPNNIPKPSNEWGVLVGEIAHNLRSALDGLVYQLARLETDTPAPNTQFPI